MLLDEDHRHAREVAQRLGQLLDDDRREPLERLIQQQEPRVGHQGARDGEHLLLAARELVALVRAPLGEAREELEHLGQIPGARLRRDREVFLHGERGEDLALLRDPADAEARAAMRRKACDRLAVPQ